MDVTMTFTPSQLGALRLNLTTAAAAFAQDDCPALSKQAYEQYQMVIDAMLATPTDGDA
tara:strand:+ start:179 stop:355 length:177 start_codon:yes stop_codon:yes gene_type:complete